MANLFTDAPDFAPYHALQNTTPLDEMNPSQATSALERAWQKESKRLFAVTDEGEAALIQRAVWYGAFGFKRPFPGDRRVLFPSEVPRSRARDD